MSAILTKLETLNNWDGCEFKDYESVKNLPETILETLWKSYADDWESYENTAKLDEDRKQVWTRRCQTEDDEIDYTR
jgi:Txe/YoeB family toxin of Txe-Axe toxin-antitoxin module